jgi:hypothetical protein
MDYHPAISHLFRVRTHIDKGQNRNRSRIRNLGCLHFGWRRRSGIPGIGVHLRHLGRPFATPALDRRA